MTMTFDAASRLVTMTFAAAKTAYTFDAAGNTILENLAGVTTGYVYDCENHMKKQTAPDGSFLLVLMLATARGALGRKQARLFIP